MICDWCGCTRPNFGVLLLYEFFETIAVRRLAEIRDARLKMVLRIAMTLDIAKDDIGEYKKAHEDVPVDVKRALIAVGIRNLSLWVLENGEPVTRMFYYAEYVGVDPFDVAMQKYSQMPGVKVSRIFIYRCLDYMSDR